MADITDTKGRETIVKIGGDGDGPGGRKRKKKTPARPSKMRPRIGRRRLSSGITIYDTGQIKAGDVYVDIPFKWAPVPTFLTLGTGGNAIFTKPGNDMWLALRDYLLEIPAAEWKDNYRKLEYEDAERYGLDILDGFGLIGSVGRDDSRYTYDGDALIDGDKWKPAGFVRSEPVAELRTRDAGAFYFLNQSPTFIRITNEPEYTADAVSFSLAKDAIIYMTPRIVSWHFTQHTPTPGGANDGIFKNVIGSYRAYSREFWLNRTDDNLDYPFLTWQEANLLTIDAVNSAELSALIQTDSDRKVYQADYTVGPGVFFSDLGTPAGIAFDTGYIEIDTSVGDNRVAVTAVKSPSSPFGALVGVIEQAGQFFYFWRSAAGDQGSAFPGFDPASRLLTLT